MFPPGFGYEAAKMLDKSDLGIEDRRPAKLLIVQLLDRVFVFPWGTVGTWTLGFS